jgi:outer membrane protein
MSDFFKKMPVCGSVLILAAIQLAAANLTLEDAVRSALERNPQVRIAREKAGEARLKRWEAFSAFLPQVSAQGTFVQLDQAQQITVEMPNPLNPFGPPVEQRFSMGPDYNYMTSLRVAQPLFTWGKIYHAYCSADAGVAIADADYARVREEVAASITQLYYLVVLNRELAAIAQEAADVTAEHLQSTRLMYNEGKVSAYDVSRVEVQYNNARTGLMKARNAYALAREQFYTAVNAPDDGADFVTPLRSEPVTTDIPALIAEALRRRPDLIAMGHTRRTLQYARRSLLTANLPSFTGAYSYNYQNPIFGREEWGGTWNVSLVVSWDLFTGLRNLARIRQVASSINQLDIGREGLERAIATEVRKYCFDLANAGERIRLQEQNIALAKDNLRIANQRYALGYISSVEVRDVQLALAQAEMERVSALFEWNVARVMLEKSIGRKLDTGIPAGGGQ